MSPTDQLRRQLNVVILNYCHRQPFADQKSLFRVSAQAVAEVLADLVTSASANNPDQARKLVREMVHLMAERMESRR
jgi:hypothetical protein